MTYNRWLQPVLSQKLITGEKHDPVITEFDGKTIDRRPPDRLSWARDFINRGGSDLTPAPLPQSSVIVGLQGVATGLVSPITGTFAPGHDNDLFIVDQTGQVWD